MKKEKSGCLTIFAYFFGGCLILGLLPYALIIAAAYLLYRIIKALCIRAQNKKDFKAESERQATVEAAKETVMIPTAADAKTEPKAPVASAPSAPAKNKAAVQTEAKPLKGGIKHEPSLNEYRMFSEPAELHKSINQLRGMLGGIAADGNMSEMEVDELAHWCSLHANLRGRHPFSEILPLVEKATADGKIDEEERQDVLWVCSNFADDSHYYNVITSSIQFLNGLVHGILADNQLSDKEIEALNTWVTCNDYLKGTCPFDSLLTLISRILQDQKISESEREELTAFLGGIVEFKDSLNLDEKYFEELRKKYSIGGICAANPEISFDNKAFVLSGEFEIGTKQTALEAINRLGGVVRTNPSGRTDFLVIGNLGNPCWKYANYGRNVNDSTSTLCFHLRTYVTS